MANAPVSPPAPQAMLARGQVWHQRLRPRQHRFTYDTYFLMLPMRQGKQAGWSVPRRKWGLITFDDRDHGEGGRDALAWIESLLQREGLHDADGEIWLQTYPRVLGHAFKPVSFWYAYSASGRLLAVVAEVNNTFGERHCYLLSGPDLQPNQTITASKVFHVSPFCRVEGHYAFRFDFSGNRVLARVDLHDDQGALIQTSMSGQLQPFTARAAWSAFWATPFMTLGVVARIHWHALRLVLKRVPFFHKPDAPERFVTR